LPAIISEKFDVVFVFVADARAATNQTTNQRGTGEPPRAEPEARSPKRAKENTRRGVAERSTRVFCGLFSFANVGKMAQGLAAGGLTETQQTERSESAQLSGANPNPSSTLTRELRPHKPRGNRRC